MKKRYIRPDIICQEIDVILMSAISGNETSTTPVHIDDPQDPGNAMSRRGHDIWEEDELQ